MKKGKYFNYNKKSHIIYDYLKKSEIIVILKGVSENSNSQKKQLFLKL